MSCGDAHCDPSPCPRLQIDPQRWHIRIDDCGQHTQGAIRACDSALAMQLACGSRQTLNMSMCATGCTCCSRQGWSTLLKLWEGDVPAESGAGQAWRLQGVPADLLPNLTTIKTSLKVWQQASSAMQVCLLQRPSIRLLNDSALLASDALPDVDARVFSDDTAGYKSFGSMDTWPQVARQPWSKTLISRSSLVLAGTWTSLRGCLCRAEK